MQIFDDLCQCWRERHRSQMIGGIFVLVRLWSVRYDELWEIMPDCFELGFVEFIHG